MKILAGDATAAGRRPPGFAVDGPGALYQRHAKRVYALALAILRSREEAEDLTQEVFGSLCAANAYDPRRGSPDAFLTTLTRSRAIDRLRCRRRSRHLLATWHDASRSAPGPATPFERVALRCEVERVSAALAELPGAQRRVVEMAYYGGLSQREIAAELDTPLGTVKTWSRYALRELGHALEDLVA